VFRDNGWEYDDPASTLALTTVTYGVDSAVMLNAEIEVNSHDHKLSTAVPTPPGSFDLQTILTHEAGHFLGLAHATKDSAVMYAYYSDGARELTPDDIEGICTAYPPAGDGSASCGVGPPARTGRGALGAGLLFLAFAPVARIVRARRRR
jgi:hypothetical protein